ncbi:MAG: flagellin, partial [Oscillospiraceae bacterium]
QAVRNSQDGINMIQTFEGAAQESHNILQRMKELASESANGTYDNSTDRAAIQLEFDQLNDELNQIADTDFNGTVALNGGTMADGTKAAGGVIDYKAESARDPKQIGGTYINGIGTANYDFTAPDGDDDATSKTIEFTVEVADQTDGSKKYTWTASDGSTVTSKDNGGFEYDGAVIGIDTSNLISGDSVKITFNKNTDEVKDLSTTIGSSFEAKKIDGTVTSGSFDIDLDEDDLTAELADALNALNGAKITEDVAADGTVSLKTTALTGTGDMGKWAGAQFTIDTDGKISYNSNTVTTAVQLGTWTAGSTADNNIAGSIENTLVIGESTYKAADPGSIKVIEPEGVVSKANSYDNSKAEMTYAKSITLQTGARTKDSVNFTFNYNTDGTADMGDLKANLNISARADGLNTENLSLATQGDANYAIDQIDKAINKVSMVRASFGSIQNRLEHKIDNLTTTSTNLTEAESAIRDTDMASEMMNYTKYNILQQAAQSMLAQANQQPQSVLQLLG